ncbi:MAG: MBL fold metallo-hydrolase [Ruminococcaceae bacterium]|jgi:phosphoribosyl 1,2-cyclic phosphodiesterase|nr:MBL fold metallo-hydrolase [Oscillospiraceae bacterium]
MEQHGVSVTILGARGSVPVSGSQFSRYGGATTCALFHADGRFIVIDAGTGLSALPAEAMRASPLPLLLTHAHSDHLIGFPLSPCAMNPKLQLDVYGVTRGGLDVRAQVERLLAPPLWPVGPDMLPADIRFFELPETLRFGGVTVEAMEGVHPSGVSLLRLTADGKRVVFATDCTLADEFKPKLTEFIRGCDILFFDGQYTDEEWPARKTFGHSSWGHVARFARACGVERLCIIHHDPLRTDDALDRAADAIRAIGPDYRFAKEGEVFTL